MTGRCYQRLGNDGGSGGRGRRGGAQLPAQLLDLVAQLGRVLEPQLLRGREHLLLELHDELFDLVAAHAVGFSTAAAAAWDMRLRLEREELGDVGDPFADRLRRDA